MEVYTGLRGIGKIHTRTVFLLVLNTKKGEWGLGRGEEMNRSGYGYKRVGQGTFVMELFCILTMVAVTHIYTYDKVARNSTHTHKCM